MTQKAPSVPGSESRTQERDNSPHLLIVRKVELEKVSTTLKVTLRTREDFPPTPNARL